MPRSTKKLIRETLKSILREKSLDEITVQMVCDEGCISRQTFYNHFYCLIDAFEDFFENGFSDIKSKCSYLTWDEGWALILEYLYENRQMLLHIYNSSYRGELIGMLDRIGRSLVKNGIEQCSHDFKVSVSERDRMFLLDYYMYIFMGFIRGYFKTNMKEPPNFISKRIGVMLEQNIRNSLPKLKELEIQENLSGMAQPPIIDNFNSK